MDVVYFFPLSQMLYNDFNFAVRFWTCEAVPLSSQLVILRRSLSPS